MELMKMRCKRCGWKWDARTSNIDGWGFKHPKKSCPNCGAYN